MKRILRSAVMTLLIVVMGFSMFTPTVHAADAVNTSDAANATDEVNVEIPFAVTLSGNVPGDAEEYIVCLQAAEASVPMPGDSVDGTYTMKVSGAGNFGFPTITYQKVGIYSYTVMQEKGGNSLCTYDGSVYDVIVYVTNADDGSGMESTVVAYHKGETKEKADPVFDNFYETPAPPADIPVESPAVDTVVTPPPALLIQTGQLTWPIPVLCGFGILLIIFGGIMIVKKRKNDHA